MFGLGIYSPKNYGKNSNSYVTNLFNESQIAKPIVSFYLSFEANDSELIFGGYDASKLANPNSILYHDVQFNGSEEKGMRWNIPGTSITLSNLSLDLEWKPVQVASGYSFIGLSTEYYDKLVNYLK